jgi:putative tricarboxylic transport membrane protein
MVPPTRGGGNLLFTRSSKLVGVGAGLTHLCPYREIGDMWGHLAARCPQARRDRPGTEERREMTERTADTISGLFLIAVALVFGVAAQLLPTTIAKEFAGPSFMPTLLAIAIGICGMGIVIQARSLPDARRMPGWSKTDRAGAIRIAVVAGATAGYNLLLEPLGYLIVTFAFLVGMLWYLKVSWFLNLTISLIATVSTYALFVIWLKVVLPMGLLEFYF